MLALQNEDCSSSKEAANDYRYFPEPDLQPIHVGEEQIAAVLAKMPALPRNLYLKYTSLYLLSEENFAL